LAGFGHPDFTPLQFTVSSIIHLSMLGKQSGKFWTSSIFELSEPLQFATKFWKYVKMSMKTICLDDLRELFMAIPFHDITNISSTHYHFQI
jgi:hypothetical protein